MKTIVVYRGAIRRLEMPLGSSRSHPRAPHPMRNSKRLNDLTFATNDKAVVDGFVFSVWVEKTREIDIPFKAQSDSECASQGDVAKSAWFAMIERFK